MSDPLPLQHGPPPLLSDCDHGDQTPGGDRDDQFKEH